MMTSLKEVEAGKGQNQTGQSKRQKKKSDLLETEVKTNCQTEKEAQRLNTPGREN